MNQYILDAVGAVLVPTLPVVGGFLIRFLQTHIGTNKTQLLMQEVYMVVNAVEQMATSGQIEKTSKFGSALAELKQIFPKETETKLRHYIEAAVSNLNATQGHLLEVGTVESTDVYSTEGR